MKSLISCFFIVFFCFYSALASEENRERAFYAISSLKYHLEQKLSNKESEDQIAFEEDDIAVLWEKAYSDSEIDPLINSAYTNYYQALERNNLQLFNQSRVHLHHAWQTISDSKFRSLIQTTDSISKAAFKSYPNFDDNPYLDESMRQRIRPHLLPIDHPAKIFLDEIFKNINAIKNYEIFTGLGFKKIAQNTSLCIVAGHPDLKKYVFKVYLFTQKETKQHNPGWEALTMRCEVAAEIRELIKRKKIHYFDVPDKWIYVLPPAVYSPLKPDENLQPILLVARKAPLVSQRETMTAWKKEITRDHLDEFYCILSHGYGSTALEINVPYTSKDRFFFIDTEISKREHNYEKVKRYLSPKMQSYWDKLVRKGGNL